MKWLSLIFTVLTAAIPMQTHAASKTALSFNLGLGYGKTEQNYGPTTDFNRQTIGGHAEFNFRFYGILFGAGYLTLSQLNIGENRDYVSMPEVHAGLGFGRLEIIGGVGAGQWRRSRQNELTVPFDSDYRSQGTGYMVGVRLFPFQGKNMSVGLSATYYQMKSEEYKSELDGVKANVTADSKASGSLAAIVFRFSGGPPGGFKSK